MIVVWAILIIFGVASIFAPEGIWQLEEQMRYKDSDREPSTASLVLIRLTGVVIIAITIFGMFQSCSGKM